jgi:DNA-binding YbaB/EbfC family protein
MRANIPKGMGGGMQNMQSMLRQAQKMQEDMAAKQEELNAREYDVSAGGGVVKVKINGKKEILSIDLAPEIVAPDDIGDMQTLTKDREAIEGLYAKGLADAYAIGDFLA